MEIKVKKLDARAKLPAYAHPGDAGMDFFCLEDATVPAGGRYQFPTGIAMEIPNGYVLLIWDKSGLSSSAGLKILGGVIDSSYRGEIKIALYNSGTADYVFAAGDKIAQGLIHAVEQPTLIENEELSSTARSDGAFGSTGK